MKDVEGKSLKLGQKVLVTSNSKFKAGVLYNYRPNNARYYRSMVEFVANPPADMGQYDWRRTYYTKERVEEQANVYYVRFEDGKTRKINSPKSIFGLNDENNT